MNIVFPRRAPRLPIFSRYVGSFNTLKMYTYKDSYLINQRYSIKILCIIIIQEFYMINCITTGYLYVEDIVRVTKVIEAGKERR